MQEPIVFSHLIAETKDGEWGEGQESPGHVLCDVIRGTDFADLHAPGIELPQRWIPEHLVARKALAADDILIETAGGTAKQSTGRTALITKEFLASRGNRPVLCSSFARHLRVDADKVHPVYLYYVLQALYASGYMGVFNLQHTGVARFQFTAFRTKTRLTLHDKEAQPKIAAALRSYDDLIANNQRRIALLESMAEEIYREWFVRMRCPVDTEANRSSKRLQAFDSLCELQRGFDLPDSDMQPGNVPVIASTTIKGFHNVAKVEPPVITTGRSGSLGTVLYVREPAWPLNTSLWVKDFKGNSPNLVYFTLRGLHLENFNAGAGVPTLNRNHLKSIKVRIPTPASQSRFDELVEPMLVQAGTLRLACAKLISTRDYLLPRLISGKLRVDALDIKFPPSMQPPSEETAQATSIKQGLVHSGA